MTSKILIVEDQFIEANNLSIILEKAGYYVLPIARSVPEALEIMETESPDLVLLDILLDGPQTGIDLAWMLKDMGIAFIFLSANSNKETLEAAKATSPYGFLVKPFRKKDILVALDIAGYIHSNQQEAALKREAGLQHMLRNLVKTAGTAEQKITELVRLLQPYIPLDLLNIIIFDSADAPVSQHSCIREGYDNYRQLDKAKMQRLVSLSEERTHQLLRETLAARKKGSVNTIGEQSLFSKDSWEERLSSSLKFKSFISLILEGENNLKYLLLFMSSEKNIFHSDHLSLLNRWKDQISAVITGVCVNGQLLSSPSGRRSSSRKGDTIIAFKPIIGKSPAMLRILDQLMIVSKTDTTVLISGESGTGKERIADAIHMLSARSEKPFIKVNCATLPAEIVESELFGHEAGAFTGATDRRIGKFEQAGGGTLFLDEIGEMPFEIQKKLLRALQEKEIERIGGAAPIKVDIRIIAATNRVLEREVAAGRFRIDLFYRLHVFPLELPSLRQRREDIPQLTEHFTGYYANMYNKNITGFRADLMQQMSSYHWPGNIRELEHFVERSVLQHEGPVIQSLGKPFENSGNKDTPVAGPASYKSLDELETEHILAVLESCSGKVAGRGGAAEILGLNVSTLHSRLKKLGIGKEKIIKK